MTEKLEAIQYLRNDRQAIERQIRHLESMKGRLDRALAILGAEAPSDGQSEQPPQRKRKRTRRASKTRARGVPISSTVEAVLALLERAPRGLTRQDLMHRLDVDGARVSAALTRVVEQSNAVKLNERRKPDCDPNQRKSDVWLHTRYVPHISGSPDGPAPPVSAPAPNGAEPHPVEPSAAGARSPLLG